MLAFTCPGRELPRRVRGDLASSLVYRGPSSEVNRAEYERLGMGGFRSIEIFMGH